MRLLVLGGIRSGKSQYAESRCSAADPTYLATSPKPPTGDPDWAARIAAHRARRPAGWTTVESADPVAELPQCSGTVLVDDLGAWVAAEIDRVGGWSIEGFDLAERRRALVAAVAAYRGDVVLVSPEVGLSPVAPTPAGRLFQDELGALNTALAAVCEEVVLVVAGRPLALTDGAGATSVAAADAARTAPEDDSDAAPAVAPSPREPRVAMTKHDEAFFTAGPEAAVFSDVVAPNAAVAEAAREHQLTLTKPAGSLGRFEELATWAAACRGAVAPAVFADPTIVVFAGDHGVAKGGVSAYPPEVTAQMVANFAGGGAAVCVLARRYGASVRVEDISVDADTGPARYKVCRGSADLRVTDAVSRDEALAGIAAGRAVADELIDSGVELLLIGEMGIGNTTPAAILIGTLTAAEPVAVVGRGTGIDDRGWIRKTAAIRDGMRRARPVSGDPVGLLAAVGGADLAAAAGFLAQAAVRRTPVILDGVVTAAAALVATELAPGAPRWWLAGHRSVEPAHRIALEFLGLDPLLDLGFRLGEGTGALAALPLLQGAVATASEMATFASAGVSTAG